MRTWCNGGVRPQALYGLRSLDIFLERPELSNYICTLGILWVNVIVLYITWLRCSIRGMERVRFAPQTPLAWYSIVHLRWAIHLIML